MTVSTWIAARPLWRVLKPVVRSARTASGRCFWRPFGAFQQFRAGVFDAAPPGSLLLSGAGPERFLVSVDDRAIGREAYVRGGFDFAKFEQALSLLPGGFERDLLVDVGANIGTICIPAVKRRLFARAVAIEPEPFNFSLLTCNLHVNGVAQRIATHHVALGAQAGAELAFELSTDNFGDHRIRVADGDGRLHEAGRQVIRVKCERFDDIVGEIDPNATLVWMDTQGFEGFVLQGAPQALRRRPPLVIEFWPYGMQRTGCYDALKQALLDAGYAAFHDLGTRTGPVPLSADTLDAVRRRLGDGGPFTDLLLQ